MSDLISSLIVPKTSQESFHSTRSRLSSSPLVKPTRPDTELEICDIDTYLKDEENKALLATNTKQGQGSSSKGKRAASNSSPPQPVQLGVRTSQHVGALYHLCQERSIVPEFEIDGDQSGFGGVLRIGEQTVTSDQKWRSKKEAKEDLAEKGVEVVRWAEVKGKSPKNGGGGCLENWVGKLLEYQNAIDPTLGPTYIEYALGLSFACTVQIPSHSTTFGSVSDPFPTKKAARSNAAREAVHFLISQDLTNSDGTPKARNKKIKLGTAVRIDQRGMEVMRGTSWAQRVADLCPLLNLPTPTYRLTALAPSAPTMLSGSACFTGNPILPGNYGEVRNVYGKKNAKEECARGLFEVLKDLARARGVSVDVDGEEAEVEGK